MKRSDLLFLVGAALVAAALWMAPPMIIAAPVPIGPSNFPMAWAQKIFYFHVPSAWCAFLSVFVAAAGSAAYLAKRSPLGDAVAVAAAELVVVFGICVLVTGPLWARKEWGVWWVWKDVRLVTMLILWITFVAYLFVRRYGGPGREKFAAGFALLGALNVPLVYLSVFFWRTQHPQGRVVSTLDPRMRGAFWISFVTFTVLYALLLALRIRLARLEQRLDGARLAADDAGLLDGEES